jgi:hypothetical protein
MRDWQIFPQNISDLFQVSSTGVDPELITDYDKPFFFMNTDLFPWQPLFCFYQITLLFSFL